MPRVAFWRAWSMRVGQRRSSRWGANDNDADQTVAAFAARLKDAVDLDTVCEDLARVVQTALEPARVSVWTSRPEPAALGGHGLAAELPAGAAGRDDDIRR